MGWGDNCTLCHQHASMCCWPAGGSPLHSYRTGSGRMTVVPRRFGSGDGSHDTEVCSAGVEAGVACSLLG